MKNFSIIAILCVIVLFSCQSKANANYFKDYLEPCYTINGTKYCNANGGSYFYHANNFWMCLNRINNNGYIIDQIYVQYNPQTKKIGEIITKTNNALIGFTLEMAQMEATVKNQTINVNAPAQTAAEYKTKLEQQEKQAAEKAKKKAAEEAAAKAIVHQKALTAALNAGTLPSCKKLYWKYLLLYTYSVSNPEPFKNIEGTELTYCKLKDNSTAMLQFKDTIDNQTGAKYRGLSLMDFTGKTKYYPWN